MEATTTERRKFTGEQLAEILAKHKKWRRGEADGARADLADAYLAGANLAGADLAGADLAGAYLADATNVPVGVEKNDPPEPYVRRVDGAARAAYAQRYRERHPEVPVVERLDARILEAIEATPASFNMGVWHSECGTMHCRAGHAVLQAGDAGRELERQHGTRAAAAMIYRASTGRTPHFFASNEHALEDIRACAAAQTAASTPEPGQVP